jgi:hypothetical protein
MSFVLGLDAGHGLKTPGKRTPDGIHEWTLNNNVCLEVQRLLSTYDVDVIRLDDHTGATDKPLLQRIGLATAKAVDACVSVHHNAGGAKATGVEVLVHPSANHQSIALANQVLKYFSDYTGLPNRGLKNPTAFTMLSKRPFPTILCEGGFMDGEHDTKVIRTKAYYTAYAKAIVKALVDLYKIKKKTTVAPKKTTDTAVKVYGVTTAKLALREEGKKTAPQIGVIPTDKKVLIIKKGNSYHKVKVTIDKKVYTGYAAAKYIKL